MTTTIEPPTNPSPDKLRVAVAGTARSIRHSGRPASDLLTVRVTNQHILDGEPGNPEKCPVAFAMVEAALANKDFRPGSMIYPREVIEKIDAYDRGEGMEPFTFVAEPSF